MLQAFQPLLEADESFPLLNQMKVSVAWIGILLIVSVLVYFTVYGYHVWEKFQNPPDTAPVLEGFAAGNSQRLIPNDGTSRHEGFAAGAERQRRGTNASEGFGSGYNPNRSPH